MALPTLRDGDLVPRPKRPRDADAEAFLVRSAEEEAAGKSVNLLAVGADDDGLLGSFSVIAGSPRAGIDDPIYARCVWERT